MRPEGPAFVRPGMFGHAQVVGSAPYMAMLIPDTAISADGVRRVVTVVNADGSTAPKPVELGPLIGSLRVVRSGLAPNDRVIVGGAQRVMMPGQKVQATVVKITQAPQAAQTAPVTTAAPASTATPSD